MFPENKYAAQILSIVLDNCYEDTFGLDDNVFLTMQKYPLTVGLDRKELTRYQEVIGTLMKSIDAVIENISLKTDIQNIIKEKKTRKHF